MTCDIIEAALSCGLRLEVHRWRGAGDGSGTSVVCIPGLTRNARDFAAFASHAAATGRDVYAISLRGRGGSDADPDYLSYHPLTYRADIIEVLAGLAVERAIFVGTSLGGIVTMLVHAAAPKLVAGAVLNDIGPELAPEGLARIAGYVGAARGDAASLEDAAAQIRAINEVAFPDREASFWTDFARNTYRQLPDGRWVLDYDQNIGRALLETGPAPDLWPAFSGMAQTPLLVVRGALSDLLTQPIIERMRVANPAMKAVAVADTGHAPTLVEPDAWDAISDFLKLIG